MGSIRLYIKESFDELVHNVTWPTWPELMSATGVVLVATVIFALVTLLMDTVSNGILSTLYSL